MQILRPLTIFPYLAAHCIALLLTACNSTEPPAPEVAGIQPGLYESFGTVHLFVEDGFYGPAPVRALLQIEEDGTYRLQRFAGPGNDTAGFRFQEEAGRLELEDSLLHKSEIQRHTLKPFEHSIAYWTSPYDEAIHVLKAHADSFQTRSLDLSLPPLMWRRVSGPALQPDLVPANTFTDPNVGYSIRFLDGWNSQYDIEINHIPYDFSSTEAIPGGRDAVANLNALTSAGTSAGETLEQRMDTEITAVGEWFYGPVTVLSRKTTTRHGRTVAEAIVRVYSNLNHYTYREKLVLFEGPHGTFTLIRYLDLDSLYDGNTAFPAIDSSLTFF